MSNRRKFIKESFSVLAVASISKQAFADNVFENPVQVSHSGKKKLRFAIASDGHYGQSGIDYKKDHENLVRWLNEAHEIEPFDFLILNGDLVHDKPELLKEVKANYYDSLKMPFYTVPGNHDHADGAIWNAVFGYPDNYVFEKNGIGFVLANTSDTKGSYRCPDNRFLKEELDKLTKLKTVFVVLHIPPHFWVPESPFVECPDTIKLLHSYPNIKAVFHGHDHSLDSVFYTGKLPHFFDSHFGGNWGTIYKGYRIVEVGDDDKLITYQVNANNNPVLNQTKF
jgi:hypothetical protein